MSGLSHRVMNMKFMQKTDKQDQRSEKELGHGSGSGSGSGSGKVKDSSEWINPHSHNLVKRVQTGKKNGSQNSSLIQSIGYGSINAFNRVARTPGVMAGEDEEEEEDQNAHGEASAPPIIPTRRTWGSDNSKATESNNDEELLALKITKLKDDHQPSRQQPKSDFQKLNNNNRAKQAEDISLESEDANEPSSNDKLDTLWNSIGKKRKQDDVKNDNNYQPQIKNKRKRFQK